MAPMTDRMFRPARHQAQSLTLFWVMVRRLCYTLAQKGDPTL
ncbi:hypothetical protein [Enterobacter ludwigii]|nr:hypothetical protein [Enterobacter ludwigii]